MNIQETLNNAFEAIYQFLVKLIPYIKDAWEKLKEQECYSVYIPFVGWIYAMVFLFEDDFIMKHTRLAFIAALVFTLVPVSLSFIKLFTPASLRVLRLIAVILIYLSHALYLAICVWGTSMIHRHKFAPVPIIEKYAKRLDV